MTIDEPITDEQRRKVWMSYPIDARIEMLIGVLDAMFHVEDVSTEQAIQRVIDTFQCDHKEVIDALREMSERDLGPDGGSGHPETWGND